VSPIIDRMILRATNFEAQIGRISGELKTVICTAELGSVTLKRIGCTQTFVCVECLIGKQKNPILFKVTEPSSIPYRVTTVSAEVAGHGNVY
jgi:hypothetical protein